MRTDEEILERIEKIKPRDVFGHEITDLIIRLPFEKAKKFLKEGTKEEDWQCGPRDRDSILKEMKTYMDFAWLKANGERGLSAGRSMNHYNSWIWLACDDLGDMTNYEYYGKDNLVKICNHYGWDSSVWDDDIRSIK